MAAGKYPVNPDGREPVNPNGRIYQNANDDPAPCCCFADCTFCDAPLPTAWDCNFTGINTCTAHATPATSVRVEPYFHQKPTGLLGESCFWDTRSFPGAQIAIFSNGIGGANAGITYFEKANSGWFQGNDNPYGPDCTATITATNTLISSGCTGNSTGQSGWGGSVSCLAVMPP